MMYTNSLILALDVISLISSNLIIFAHSTLQINIIHEQGAIDTIDYRENGTYVLGKVPRSLAMKLDQYSIANGSQQHQQSDDSGDDIDWVALGKGRHEKKNARVE